MFTRQAASKLKFPYTATVVAFLAIVIMLGLGFWQLERKAEKDLRIANIQKAALSAQLPFSEIVSDISQYQDYVVQLKGQAVQQFFYIDNKLRNGKAGYHVLVPYITTDGVVMLNLGWLEADGVRADVPSFPLPDLHNVQGIVYIPTINRMVTETNRTYGDFPVVLQQVDLIEIEKHLGMAVLPVTIRLVNSMPNQNGELVNTFVRDWQAIVMSPEKHLAYAVQWFGLAIAALTIYLLSMAKRLKGPSPNGTNTTSND